MPVKIVRVRGWCVIFRGRESANRGFESVEEVTRVFKSCEILLADIKVNVEDLVFKPECFVLKTPSGNLITICFHKFYTKWLILLKEAPYQPVVPTGELTTVVSKQQKAGAVVKKCCCCVDMARERGGILPMR
jgi:hypothetical protein